MNFVHSITVVGTSGLHTVIDNLGGNHLYVFEPATARLGTESIVIKSREGLEYFADRICSRIERTDRDQMCKVLELLLDKEVK